MWDAPYMSGENTALQDFLAEAIELLPKARDHYDHIIQAKLGTKGKPIYDVQRGKVVKPGTETLEAMAEALDQPFDLLVRANRGEPVKAVQRGIETRQVTNRGDGTVQLRQIDLSYSMGPGANIDDYVDEGTFEMDSALLQRITRSPPERLFVASGAGDSMFPTLLDNDQVVIDTAQRVLNMQDRIWAVSLFGAGAIKRLRTVGPDRVLVMSDNKDVENQEVSAEDIFLLGRVIWLGRRV
jgi:phage repressor protein C with HTH and peptisase S24 domain